MFAPDLGQRPAGLLRLTVPRAVVPILLESLIASFCQAYPEVEVEIAASADLVDIAFGNAFPWLIDHSLTTRRSARRCASPNLISCRRTGDMTTVVFR